MDCKEFEKQISNFIEKKLDYYTLKRFCAHLDDCEDCKEELTIKLLLTEGMQRLEDGKAFDLNAEVKSRVKQAKARLSSKDKNATIGLAFELIAFFIFAGIVIVMLV